MTHLTALVCLTLMTGSELCVAAFVNPILRQLPEEQQTPFLRRAASHLGFVMPFWYIASLVLTCAAACTLHHTTAGWNTPATWSALLQVAIIVMTVTLLVPINNRLSKLQEGETGWTPAAGKWDRLHQLRVLLLLVAVGLLAVNLIVPSR